MPPQSHAITGAHTLEQRLNLVAARVDARVAFELVGTAFTEMEYIDPILAIRTWLDDEQHTAEIADDIVALAAATLDHAEAHLRALDLFAGQVAMDANSTGILDASRLDQLDSMSGNLQRYSVRLRQALDDSVNTPRSARTRLTRAVDAGQLAGFDALVSALRPDARRTLAS
ncbi:MAG: hypothetical protein JWN41_1604 [Thermoleophilia bacterium]|nr:hypothetical protein [Thermoleophilia bacterium]